MESLGCSSAKTRPLGGGAGSSGHVRDVVEVHGQEAGGGVTAIEVEAGAEEGGEGGETEPPDREGTEGYHGGVEIEPTLEDEDPSLHLVLSENGEGEDGGPDSVAVSEPAGGDVLVEGGGVGDQRPRQRALAADF